jgi:hypothetical protein
LRTRSLRTTFPAKTWVDFWSDASVMAVWCWQDWERCRLPATSSGAGSMTPNADQVLLQLDDLHFRQFLQVNSGIDQIRVDLFDEIAWKIAMLGFVFFVIEHQIRSNRQVGSHESSPNDLRANRRS